jgi:RNA polymerase sigma factor (sigma-70 family)
MNVRRTLGFVATPASSACSPALDASAAQGRSVVDLFDLHAPGLYRLAAAMLHDPDIAQDVVQDTFLKLLQHLASGASLANAKGWLYTVAAHACRDRQRRSWRWLPWVAELDRRRSAETADRSDGHRTVMRALHRLRPRDRLLVTLRAQGLSYEDIAAAAGIQPASVGRLLARALDRLARELALRKEMQT